MARTSGEAFMLSRSFPFAFLTPLSAEAAAVVVHPHNNPFVDDHCNFSLPIPPRIRLDFRTLFGRPSLSFGSSRHNEVVFPQAAGIDPRHFVIHFEKCTGLLLFTDTSQDGTLMSDDSAQTHQLLREATRPLLRDTIITLGRDFRYRFLLSTTDYARKTKPFALLFTDYAKSVGWAVPTAVKRLCTACDPVVMLSGASSYYRLHHVRRGGFGTIHTCLRTSDGALFAVKTPIHGGAKRSSRHARAALESARREALLLRKFRHPNVVKFVDQLHDLPGSVVIEFLPNGSLDALLNQHEPPRALESQAIRALVRQCLFAIEYLNRNDIIHHDIKPQNILVQSTQPIKIKLCDLGCAQDIVTIHATGQFVGTKGYMAPEFASDLHSFGVDVYALGTVMLNAFGFWPWQPQIVDNVALLPSFAHLPCATLLAGMLEADPNARLKPKACLSDSWLKSCHILKRPFVDDSDDIVEPPAKRRKTFHVTHTDSDMGENLYLTSSVLSRLFFRIRGQCGPRLRSTFPAWF